MKLTNEKKIIVIFSLIFGWVLSFTYQGPVFFGLVNFHGIDGQLMSSRNMFAHAVGLLLTGFIIKKPSSKSLISLTILCFLSPYIIFIVGNHLWSLVAILFSFLSGLIIGSFGSYIMRNIPIKKRAKTIAYILIFSNLILTLCSIMVRYYSAYISFLFIQILLAISIVMLFFINDNNNTMQNSIPLNNNGFSIKQYSIFYLFIFIITINTGIMYSIIYPYFYEFDFLISHYANIPYILAIILLSLDTKNHIRQHSLYTGLSLWGITFIIFGTAVKSPLSAFVILSIMLFTCGIFDFFWWSVIAQNLEKMKNPSLFWGLGLATNAFGVWVGSMISYYFFSPLNNIQSIAMFGLFVVVICISIILPLSIHLSKIITSSPLLIEVPKTINRVNEIVIDEVKSKLTNREYEVFICLIKGFRDNETSKALYIANTTIKSHNKKIYRKLEVKNRKELISKYQQYFC